MILTKNNVNQVNQVHQVFPADAPARSTFGLEMLSRMIGEYHSRMAGMSPQENTKSELMRLTLMTGVPLHVHDLKKQGGPSESDIEFCHRFGLRIASQADRLQFRSKGEWVGDGDKERVEAGTDTRRYHWSTAELMAQMIRAVAIMAFFPGGITIFGLHFEAEKTWTAGFPRLRPKARFRRRARGRRR